LVKIPSVPAVVCTRKPEIRGTNVLFRQGIVEYLTKPIAQEKLVEAAKRATQACIMKTSPPKGS